MAVSLGKLSLAISLGSGAFEQSANRVSRSFNKMVGRIRRHSKVADKAIGGIVSATRGVARSIAVIGKTIGLGLGVAAAGATATVLAIKQLGEKYKELGKQAQEYGVTLRDLLLTQRLASDFGADYEKLLDFRKDFQEKLGEAITEQSGEGFDALRILGIDPKTIGEDVDKALGMVMEKVVHLSETRRKHILGMLAGVGADITTESIGVLLAQFGDMAEEVNRLYDHLVASEETIQRADRMRVQMERISAVVAVLKERILTTDWMARLVDFAQNFSFGLLQFAKAGELGAKMKDLFTALKEDLKTVGIYFLDIMSWAITEMGKRMIPMLANSVSLGITEGLPPVLRGIVLGGPAGQPLRLRGLPSPEPFPKAGEFRIDDVAKEIASKGMKVAEALDKVVSDITLQVNKTTTTAAANLPVDIKALDDKSAEKTADREAKRHMDALARALQAHQNMIIANTSLPVSIGMARGVKAGVMSMRDIMQSNLLDWLADSLAKTLNDFRSRKEGGGGALGAIAGFAGKLLGGFQHGGSFEVGGRSGVDANIVSFRATKGERVNVEPAGRTSSGMALHVTVTNSFGGANIRAASNEELAAVAKAAENGAVNAVFRMRREGRI